MGGGELAKLPCNKNTEAKLPCDCEVEWRRGSEWLLGQWEMSLRKTAKISVPVGYWALHGKHAISILSASPFGRNDTGLDDQLVGRV